MKEKLKFITSRLLAVFCLATAVFNVTAQEALLVHPADGGKAQSFLLDNIQKVTFSGDNLLLKTAEGDETIPLTNVNKITFEVITGIAPVSPGVPEITLYPNPAVDHIIINSPVDIKSWTLFNLNGKAVRHSVSDKQIAVTDLPAGFYFLKLDTASGSVTKKIIKR